MKRIITAAALALAVSGAAVAQTATTTTTVPAPAGGAATGSVSTTMVTTEQQAKVKAFVMKEKMKSVAAPAGFTVAAGATLPAAVEVKTFPADVGVKHSYTVIGDRTVLVEPGTRKIVQIIQ